MILKIIGLFIWAWMASTVFQSYKKLIYNNTKGIGTILFYLFLIIVSPVFHLNNLITVVFDYVLPEGWIVGDDEFYGDDDDK